MDFTPPAAHEIDATPTPSYRLFSGHAVGIATFLGSMFAGAIIVALNEFKLQRAVRGILVLCVGFMVTVVYTAVAYNAPDSLSAAFNAITIGIAIGSWKGYERYISADAEAHEAAGGEVGMRGWAALIGVVMLVVMLGGLFATAIVTEGGLDKLMGQECVSYLEGNEMICHDDTVTPDEVQCTLDYFAEQGLFTGSGTWSTYLGREDDATVVLGLVVDEQALQAPGMNDSFMNIHTQLSAGCMQGERLRLDLKRADLTLIQSLP